MQAQVVWPSPDSAQRPGFRGTVTITQEGPEHPAHFKVRLEGLDPYGLHGFHIHTNPITDLKDLEKTCKTCGGHFNPTGQKHGSILNKNPYERHVGDLINNVKADQNGRVCVDFYDDMATLIPTEAKDYTILGKSLVVHEGTDDLGRRGRSSEMPYVYSTGKVKKGSKERDVVPYDQASLRKESKVTGNAGGRLACGNIL
jgi:Cu/Zn superoxide dismutase